MGLIRVKNKTKINEEVIYMQYGPDPNAVYPNEAIKSVCFIKNIITRPNIIVGVVLCQDLVQVKMRFSSS